MNAPRRCGVTSLGGLYGCCRADGHDGPHCAHDPGMLTGTPGVIVVSRGLLGRSLGRCDGGATPTGDWVASSRAPGNLAARFDLIPPTEGNTP